MRLTADLILSSPSYINPLLERELDLRGHKIPTIENLGVARDNNDAIDLTDNDVNALSNFPLSPRLRSITAARNRIGAFHPQTFIRAVPDLRTLTLTQNRIAELADLDPLSGLRFLTHLVLLENPVCTKEHYRHWVVWRCPSVRFLDFQRVRDAERKRAAELFGKADEPTELAKKIMTIKSRTAFDAAGASSSSSSLGPASAAIDSGVGGLASRVKLTAKEKKKVEELIRNAKSLQDIARIERDLGEGRIPAGVQIDGDDDDE